MRWVEADALRLPFPDAHFDLITSAFGFRNLADYDAGLRRSCASCVPAENSAFWISENRKVWWGSCYRIYFKHVLPAIGTLDLRSKRPVRLSSGIGRAFPAPDEMLQRMQQAGFQRISWTPYTLGIAGLYRGRKV